MIRRWWRNFLNSFTYLNDKDIKWLKANDWFYKDVQNLPKSSAKIIFYIFGTALFTGLLIAAFCLIMVNVYYANAISQLAENSSAAFLVALAIIVASKNVVRYIKIVLSRLRRVE